VEINAQEFGIGILRRRLFFSAIFAVAADFGARRGDVDAAIFFDLLFQLFVQRGLEFADGAAF